MSNSTRIGGINVSPPLLVAYDSNPGSQKLAIATAVFFGFALLLHLRRLHKTKAFYMYLFTFGTAMATASLIVRILSLDVSRKDRPTLLLTQSLLSLAPSFMLMSMHTILGRIILYVGERYSPVPSRFVVRAFISVEVFVLLAESTGIRMATSLDLPLLKISRVLLVVGFSIQLSSLVFFFRGVMIYKDRAKTSKKPDWPWIRCCRTLYIGIILMLIRTVFRLVAAVQNDPQSSQASFLLLREVYFYGLEILPMLLLVYLFLFYHPSKYIPSDPTIRLHFDNSLLNNLTGFLARDGHEMGALSKS